MGIIEKQREIRDMRLGKTGLERLYYILCKSNETMLTRKRDNTPFG